MRFVDVIGMRAAVVGAALSMVLWACSSEPSSRAGAPAGTIDASTGAPEQPAFCARAGSDKIRDLFCRTSAPTIGSLHELQVQLELDPSQQGGYRDSTNGAPLFSRQSLPFTYVVVLSHSTALSGRLVSPINPRAVLIGREAVMAYQRGVQRVELMVRARDKSEFNFYLLNFEQACNAAIGGCSAGDLFTPQVESDWLRVEIRADEELKNTAEDCRQCHARGRETLQPLMRELQPPWTHFFQPLLDTPPSHPEPGVTGIDLTRDYVTAKGDESYASVPTDVMRHTPAVVLQGLAGMDQPLLFDSPAILRERWPNGDSSTNPLPSPIWERSYEAFQRGEQLALPYVEPRATDPSKQASLTEAYTEYRNGERSAADLPDLSDIFPDDPRLRARIGLQTEPDAEPAAALIQACGSCHNNVLDQSLSRARFSIDLATLDRAELDLAIKRIELPTTAAGVMPPRAARQLDLGAREKLLAYLRDETLASSTDMTLRLAAEYGMAKR